MNTPLLNAVAAETARQADADDAPRSLHTTGPVGSAPRPVPAPSTSVVDPARPALPGSAEPSIDALINAAARSGSKRTQALGVKLADLASVVRQRLRDERETAEQAEADKRARAAATAEVERLEAQLREARAKAGIKGRGGSGRTRVTETQRANLTGGHASGEFPCRAGCDRVLTTPAARGRHEKAHG